MARLQPNLVLTIGVFAVLVYACMPTRSPIEAVLSAPFEALGIQTQQSFVTRVLSHFNFIFLILLISIAGSLTLIYQLGLNEAYTQVKDEMRKLLSMTPIGSDSTSDLDSSSLPASTASSSTAMSASTIARARPIS